MGGVTHVDVGKGSLQVSAQGKGVRTCARHQCSNAASGSSRYCSLDCMDLGEQDHRVQRFSVMGVVSLKSAEMGSGIHGIVGKGSLQVGACRTVVVPCAPHQCFNVASGSSSGCIFECGDLAEVVPCARRQCSNAASGTSRYCSLDCVDLAVGEALAQGCAPVCSSFAEAACVQGYSSGNVATCVGDGCSNAGDGSSQYCSISCMEAPSVVAAPVLKVAEHARGATNWGSLEKTILKNGCTQVRDLQCLHMALDKFGEDLFFTTLLPFICDEAASYAHLFSDPIFVIDERASGPSRTVEWSQRQCLCILCNAFLCAWPGRTSDNCNSVEQPDLPSINFDEMMHSQGNAGAQVAKCEMFLHYVAKQHQRVQNGDLLARPVTFVRSQRKAPNWQASQAPLCPITVRPLHESIDAAKDLLRVDFANESVGGASIAYGCVQEEIMFACHPELNCARLIFPRMRENEAFILCGAEQFAEPAGYAFSLTCAGAYEDKSPVVNGRLRSFVTAIDAMDYRGHYAQGTNGQYSRSFVDRELQKAFAGFAVPKTLDAPSTLGTGNWGAGAFLGDASLKALVQWAAASEAGLLDIHYFPFDNEVLHRDLQRISESLIARGTTVRDLCAWLLNGSMQPGVPVLKQVNDAFQLGLEELGA